MSTNLVPYLDKLTPANKAVIVFVMKETGRPEVNLGNLPFLSVSDVTAAIELVVSGNRYPQHQRYCRRLLELFPKTKLSHFTVWMSLSPRKVYKHFGEHPERGKPLPHLPKIKVTAGVTWSLPKRCYVPDTDVDVAPVVALVKADNLYKVTGPCKFATQIVEWLQDNCK